MAIGFPSSYRDEIRINKSRDEVIGLIKETLKYLDWFYEEKESDILVQMPISWASWGEKIRFVITEHDTLLVESRCYFQVIDCGKNKKNVDRFMDKFRWVGTKLQTR